MFIVIFIVIINIITYNDKNLQKWYTNVLFPFSYLNLFILEFMLMLCSNVVFSKLLLINFKLLIFFTVYIKYKNDVGY